ncbi:MAG: hypothetical protein AAFN70_12375, partial [Planctomycetota bacterium]
MQSRNQESVLRQAALVLASLPEKQRAHLLAQLNRDDRNLITPLLRDLVDIDPLERKRAIESFGRDIAGMRGNVQRYDQRHDPTRPDTIAGIGEPADATHRQALDQSPDTAPTGEWADTNHNHDPVDQPFAFLESVPIVQIASAISSEHPQTIAVFLASLPTRMSAQLLPCLQPAVRDSAMLRLARLQELPQDVVQCLQQQLSQQFSAESAGKMGRQKLNEILATMGDGLMTPSNASPVRAAPETPLAAVANHGSRDQTNAAVFDDAADAVTLSIDDYRDQSLSANGHAEVAAPGNTGRDGQHTGDATV